MVERRDSVNLQVIGEPQPVWRPLVEQICDELAGFSEPINMQRGTVAKRPDLLRAILNSGNRAKTLPEKPGDLVEFEEQLINRPDVSFAALTHFEMFLNRQDYKNDHELFGCLRFVVTEERKLVLFIQSRLDFIQTLPRDHALSSFNTMKHIELRGNK
ncbi:hypothetical protein KC799_18060 [candidate division KSB1 bacterium]|nr:hypothetical protein [candidate division KSB1 bacterium]